MKAVMALLILLAASSVNAADISGTWKHVDEPGWIEIDLETGVGTVMRNDKFPERVGRKILKDLQADKKKQNLWRGQVYAERAGEYKKAEVSLTEDDLMKITVKVGFMSRTLEWKRVESVPESP